MDDGPVKIQCAGYLAPADYAGYTGKMHLEYVVDASGAVEKNTIQALPRSQQQPSESTRQNVLQIAEGCRYRPALVDGRAVRVRVVEEFFY